MKRSNCNCLRKSCKSCVSSYHKVECDYTRCRSRRGIYCQLPPVVIPQPTPTPDTDTVFSIETSRVMVFNGEGGLRPMDAGTGITTIGNIIPYDTVLVNKNSTFNGPMLPPTLAYTFLTPVNGTYNFSAQVRLQCRDVALLGTPMGTTGNVTIATLNVVLTFEVTFAPGTITQFGLPAVPVKHRVPATFAFTIDPTVVGDDIHYNIGIDSKQFSFIRDLYVGDGVKVLVEIPPTVPDRALYLLAGSTLTVDRITDVVAPL